MTWDVRQGATHLINHSRPGVKLPGCLQAAALAMGLHTTLLECVADSHALLVMHSFKAAQQNGPAAVAVTASGTTPRSPAAAGSRAGATRSRLPFPRIPGSGAAVHATSVWHLAHAGPSAKSPSFPAGYPSLGGRKPTSQSGAPGGRSAPADAVMGQSHASQEQGVVNVQPAPVQAAALDTAGELARQQLLHALSILKHMALGCPAAGRALAQGGVMDVLRRCVILAGACRVSSRGRLAAGKRRGAVCFAPQAGNGCLAALKTSREPAMDDRRSALRFSCAAGCGSLRWRMGLCSTRCWAWWQTRWGTAQRHRRRWQARVAPRCCLTC